MSVGMLDDIDVEHIQRHTATLIAGFASLGEATARVAEAFVLFGEAFLDSAAYWRVEMARVRRQRTMLRQRDRRRARRARRAA